MMQSGQDRRGCDGPEPLDGSTQRDVLAQSEVRPSLIVIETVRLQHLSQMLFAKDQEMIQAFSPKRADQTFDIWILPGCLR
jgi:hypothetical protein